MQQRVQRLIRSSKLQYQHYSDFHRRRSGAYQPYRTAMSRIVPNRGQSDANHVNEEHCGDGRSNENGSGAYMEAELGIECHKPVLLFRSEHYLVIDKPFGVRMNGAFEGTCLHLPLEGIMISTSYQRFYVKSFQSK